MNLKPEFVNAISGLLGTESQDLITAISTSTAPVSIRHNPIKNSNSVYGDPVLWASNAEYLSERPVFTKDPLFHAGAYYVQEASSMFIEQAIKQFLDLTKNLVILDLCAAPGGKSTLISALIKDADVLVSNEINKTRADILTENIQKWGSSNVIVTRNEVSDFGEITELFDCIVVDAPCSGEGMFRKTPNAISEWSLDNVKICSARQRKILDEIWPSLKPGGILVYSTCTYNIEENENQIAWLIEEMAAINLPLNTDEYKGINPSASPAIHAARFFPHKNRGEGFFMAVVQKPASQKGRPKHNKSIIKPLEKNELTQIGNLLVPGHWSYFNHRSQIFAALPELSEVLNRISPHLYPVHIGVAIGELKGKDFIPAAGLAMSASLNPVAFNRVEVTKDQALALLSRETPILELNESGWFLCTFQGLGLLWIKAIQNRINNYYPKEWRIRSDFRTMED